MRPKSRFTLGINLKINEFIELMNKYREKYIDNTGYKEKTINDDSKL